MPGKKGRRGWGWVRQSGRREKRWHASYIHDVARHNAPHTFGSKMEAEAWLANERRLIDMEVWTPPAQRVAEKKVYAVTIAEYGATWIEQRTTRGGKPLAPKSKAHYENLLADYIKPKLGNVAVRNLTAQAVRSWHAGLPDKPVMRSHAYGLLHAVYATAVKDGLIAANPCQIERAMKAQRAREPVILTVAEVATLADEITDRYRALILISAWCGLRWGEVTELRRKDIGKGCEIITVARGATHCDRECHIDTPKSGKGRVVVVPPHIREDVKTHLQANVGNEADALLFAPVRGGCHLNGKVFREHFTAALKIVGREGVRVHDLRHFCGSQTARVGNLVETMGRLGHSTVGASLIYQQIVSGRDAAVAEALSKLAEDTPDH